MSDCGVSNFGGRFFISPTPQTQPLDLTAYEAISDWEEVPNMGTSGDTGHTQNIISYSTWGRVLVCKGKGEATANDPDVEFLDAPSDGMTYMLDAAAPSNANNYAFAYVWPDGSVEYNRGLVAGVTKMKGGNEDFKRVQFTLGLQDPIVEGTWPSGNP